MTTISEPVPPASIAAVPELPDLLPPVKFRRGLFGFARRHPAIAIGGALVLAMVFVAIFAPYLGTIEAPVEVVEPTGAETIAVVRIGSREVIARFEPNAAPAVGERVTLGVDMAKACLFDSETEMLI